MQLYALDNTGKKCNVHSAKKRNDYFCLECNARVRVRSGELLRAHFYHIYDEVGCRQAGKTEQHIAIQRLIQQQIGIAYCVEEMRFTAIGRVADVAWPEKKLIFEVQCSPISAQEVQERNSDYASCGWDVVWVLYDKTFNQKRVSEAEKLLFARTHYYSDGVCIYDQVYVMHGGSWRKQLVIKRSIFLDTIAPLSFGDELPKLAYVLYKRFCSWSHYTEGDYLWAALYADEKVVKDIQSNARSKMMYLLCPLARFVGALRAVWMVILERSCR